MERRRGRGGFTLIELMIVLLVIGLLAAVTIPRFSRTKSRAFDAAAQTDLRNAVSAQEAYFADNQSYATDTQELGFDGALTSGVSLSVSAAGSSYEMTARHAAGENTYCVDSGSGAIVEGAAC